MPPSEKPKKSAANRAKDAPKTTQRPAAKSGPQAEKTSEELDVTETRPRKPTAKASAVKERAADTQPSATRPRKLTPQQQAHLTRSRRRRRNQRLAGWLAAVVVIAVIAVVARVVYVNHQTSTQQASARAAATATAAARATATEIALAPSVPPAVSGKTVTLPDGLQYIDITVGTGAAVKEGDTLSVKYTGWLQATQVKFDSSYDDNKGDTPTQFKLVGPNDPSGQGVIQGWVDGLTGMKVGGKRRLIIPPALAYGADGQPSASVPIPANATLIFDVQIVSIGTGTPTPTTTPTPTPGS